MGRKNRNARHRNQWRLAPNTHLMWSTDELYREPIVVRYMGEQDGDSIKVWHPEGFEMWTHVSHCWIPRHQAA